MDMIYIENLGVHHESRPLSPKLGVMIVTYDTDVIISYFIIRRYSGFQAAVDTPAGKIFRFVRPVAPRNF